MDEMEPSSSTGVALEAPSSSGTMMYFGSSLPVTLAELPEKLPLKPNRRRVSVFPKLIAVKLFEYAKVRCHVVVLSDSVIEFGFVHVAVVASARRYDCTENRKLYDA